MTGGPRRLLTVAGSDSGGGAGIQADLKTFAAHGAYGMSVVTALTAQNTIGVRAVAATSPEMVAAQLDAVLGDLGVDGIKVGMLAERPLVEVVSDRLQGVSRVPLVVDPVLTATGGETLLEAAALAALRERLAPLATLLTPNLPEAECLLEVGHDERHDLAELARELGNLSPAVLLKGGHAADGDEIVDLLWDGEQVHEFRHRRIRNRVGHGSGCTLSAAIVARLARGEALVAACGGAIEWLQGAFENAPRLGSGAAPLDPLWKLRREGRFA